MTLSSNTLRAVVCAVIVITAIPAGIVSLSTEVTAQSGSSDVSISNAFIQDGPFVDLTEGEPVDVVVDGTVETGGTNLPEFCYDHRIEIRETDSGFFGESSKKVNIEGESDNQYSFFPDDESFRAEVPVTIPTDEVGEDNEFEAKLIQENTCSAFGNSQKTATSSTLTHFVAPADSSDPDPEIVDDINEIRSSYITVNEQSDIPGASPADQDDIEEEIDNPPTVAVGQEITVALQVVNEGGNAGEYSGVQIQLKSIDSQSKTDAIENTGLGTAIQPGDEVITKGGDTEEATSWQIDRTFDSVLPGPLGTSVTVTPQETGEFVILMRGTYTDDQEQAGVENKFTTAGSAEDPDQDYTMRRVVVEVIDDTDDDGILNQNDEAPNEPEDDDGYQDSDGDPENPSPTVSLSGMSVTEGQQQTLSADASDPEGKSLNYEWSLNGPGQLTGSGEEVVYKAPSSPDGITRGRTADVTVTVTTTGETRGQSEKSATATAQVGLEDINPPPSVSLPDQSVKEGNKVTLTADATNPEDDGISYQWSKDGPGSLSSSGETATYTAPSDISESVSTSVSVTVTEPQGQSASASATVSVNNNQGDDDTDGDGILNQNDEAPSEPEDKDGYQDSDGDPENPPPTVSLAGMSVTEGQQQTLSADASDPEGKSLNYEWSLNGPGRLTGNGEEVVYKAPSSPDGITRGRTADVTVTVTTTGETRGQSEKSATATAQVDLEDVNPTPSVSLPDKQLSEGGTITIRASANNPEDDGISYQWSKDGPGSLSSSGEAATYTAPSDISESVSTSVSVTVTEPQGQSASASATVSVNNNQGDDDTDGDGILNQNDEAPSEPEDKDGYQDSDGDPENPPPTVSLAGMSVTEGQQQTLSADASDPEGDSLNYEWGLSGAGQLSTTSGQSVTYTAPRDISLDKSATVSVTVTEPDSGKSSQAEATISIPDNPDPAQFDIAISNTNNPPAGEELEVTAEITNTGEQTGQATVQLDTTAGEIEPTQTTVNLGGGDSTTETLTVDTTGVDPGSYTATMSMGGTASDKQFTVTDSASLIADAGDDQTVTAGETVTLDATGSQSPDESRLNYRFKQLSQLGSPPDVSLNNPETQTPEFTAPDVNSETTLTFQVKITDSTGGTDTDQVNITITPSSVLPTAAIQFDDQTVSNGSSSLTVSSATFDGTENFNIVIHQATDDNDDGVIQTREIGVKIGESGELSPGTEVNTDVAVNLTQQLTFSDDVSRLTENQILVAMLHKTDTSDDDNVVHAAPLTRNGTPVFDQADITVEQQGNSIDVTRTVSASEVAPGEEVTVTASATFETPVENAKLVDSINGGEISADEITVQSADGGFAAVSSEPQPTVDVTWNEDLNVGLSSNSVTVSYDVTVPEETPIGTTITLNGTVTETATGETATFDQADITVEQQENSIDVTRTVSATEVAPSEQVTLTTVITGVSGGVSITSSYAPQVASATVQSVTVNGASTNPIIATAERGSVVTLGDVDVGTGTGTDATVRITEELTVGEETDVTHSITGNVTAGETTTEVDPVTVTVAEPQSVVDEYDSNDDGTISITELGVAGADFARGELSITELGRLGAEFAS